MQITRGEGKYCQTWTNDDCPLCHGTTEGCDDVCIKDWPLILSEAEEEAFLAIVNGPPAPPLGCRMNVL